MKNTFSIRQRQVLTLCALMYTAAYVCRLNLSAALGSVMQALHLSMARGGMLQTAFAAIYAAGQFVNGAIVDRVNPARHILLGLAGSAACNLAMGLCASYPALLIVWSLNAVFQSMLWTPVMRLIAMYFLDDSSRERANTIITLMFIAGHFIAWAVSGFMAAIAGWRLSFIVPAAIALAVCAAMLPTIRTLNTAQQKTAVHARQAMHEPALRALLSTGFFLVLATCVLYGFIRDSIVTWAPSILSGISGGNALSSAAFTLILPAINIFGVLLGSIISRRGAKAHGVVAVMMAAAILCSAALTGAGGMLTTALLLGTICAAMYGANPALTGLIPLQYDRIGKTSLTAGMADSFIYVGSALAGVWAGGIYETRGVNTLFLLWIAAGGISAALMCLSSRMSSAYWAKHHE